MSPLSPGEGPWICKTPRQPSDPRPRAVPAGRLTESSLWATLTVWPSVSSLRSARMTSSSPVTFRPGIVDLHLVDLRPRSVADARLDRGLDGLAASQEITVGLVARSRSAPAGGRA